MFFLGKNFTESGIRRESSVQPVFHGAIERHFSVLDTNRLWKKGLSFLPATRLCNQLEHALVDTPEPVDR
jgi:hypothetical protein